MITLDDANMVETAVISSRLDYCNALLYGTSKSNFRRLQHIDPLLQQVQNSLARVVTDSAYTTNVTSILHDLHWLPVNARVNYKVASLAYKVLTTQRPAYVSNLIYVSRPVRTLRSN